MVSPQVAHLLSDTRLKTASSSSIGPGSFGRKSNTSNNHQEVKLCFGISALDEFFRDQLGGGITYGTLLEAGIPFGNGGRRLLVHFIAAANSGANDALKPWCLWISARPQPAIYPPAWQSIGVDLSRLRFASCESPVKKLKAVFLNDFFRIIIIDHPTPLSADEHVFLSQCARQYRKIIVVARDQILNPSDSNSAARYRFNVWRPYKKNLIEMTPVRGLHHSIELSPFFQRS